MAGGSGTDWRAILWSLLKPALVAAIVALLVALGVTGLRPPYEAPGGGSVGVMSTTHLSGPLQIDGGLQTGNNLTMTVGSVVNANGAVTVTDDIDVTGASNLRGAVSSDRGGITVTDDIVLWGGALIDETGAVTVSDALAVTGAAGLATFLRLTPATALTVTSWITPTGAIQPIVAEGWVSPTLNVSAGSAGDLLLLIYGSTETLFLEDTGTLMLHADWEPGQYDALLLYNDGTNWYEITRADN
jgi:hypothetical protein